MLVAALILSLLASKVMCGISFQLLGEAVMPDQDAKGLLFRLFLLHCQNTVNEFI